MIDVSSEMIRLYLIYRIRYHVIYRTTSHHIHKAARFPKSIPVYIYSLFPSQYF